MGFLKITGYILVALTAVLAYFHMECVREQDEKNKVSIFDNFDPNVTDCKNVAFPFREKGANVEFVIGLSYIMTQSAPCAVMKLYNFLYPPFEGVCAKRPLIKRHLQ